MNFRWRLYFQALCFCGLLFLRADAIAILYFFFSVHFYRLFSRENAENIAQYVIAYSCVPLRSSTARAGVHAQYSSAAVPLAGVYGQYASAGYNAEGFSPTCAISCAICTSSFDLRYFVLFRGRDIIR